MPKTEAADTFRSAPHAQVACPQPYLHISQMHCFLMEFGINLPKSLAIMTRLSFVLTEHALSPRLPPLLRSLHEHFVYQDARISEPNREMVRQIAEDDLSSRLLSIPGVGPASASLLSREMGDATLPPQDFASLS